MSKLVLNYDLMDRIYRANGQHKIRLCYKENFKQLPPTYILFTYLTVNNFVNNHLNDVNPWLSDLVDAPIYIGTWALIPLTDFVIDKIRVRRGIPTEQEFALEDIKELSRMLNEHYISTTPENILKADFYSRNYKIDMEHDKGIIRNRYFNLQTYDSLGNEITTSLLEEHKIGSKKYVLSLGKPQKKKVLKLVYGQG